MNAIKVRGVLGPCIACSFRTLLVAIACLGTVGQTHAVIINGSAAGNTSAPSDPDLATRWAQVGNISSYMGTPIASQYFITAKHLGNLTGQSITFPDASSYTTTAAFFDPNSDLAIYQISGAFPGDKIVPMYSGSFSLNQPMYIFGRGVPRTDTQVIGDAFPSGTEPKGWTWGTGNSTRSWGTNNYAGVFDAGSAGTQLLFDFDSSPADEGVLSIGDSGGPVFLQEGGVWKLAGINYAVESAFNTTGNGTGFNAAIFDKGGLYQGSTTSGPWTYVNPLVSPQPAFSLSTSVPASSAWIVSIVPEPSTLALGVTGTAFSLFVLWRRKAYCPSDGDHRLPDC